MSVVGVDEVLQVVAQVLEVPARNLTLESSPDTVPNWDSERMIELLVTVEELADVQFSATELADIFSIANILEALRSAGALKDE